MQSNNLNNFLKTREEIEAWIDNNCFTNATYSLIPDDKYGFVVEVYGDIGIGKYWEKKSRNNKITHVPVKFSAIMKDFICSNNALTNLEFAPHTVGKSFNCSDNLLTSLKGAPQRVDGDFLCSDNSLVNLKGGPLYVGKGYYCKNNQLETLEFIPEELGHQFFAEHNEGLGAHQNIKSLSELEKVSEIYKQKAILEKELKPSSLSPSVLENFKI